MYIHTHDIHHRTVCGVLTRLVCGVSVTGMNELVGVGFAAAFATIATGGVCWRAWFNHDRDDASAYRYIRVPGAESVASDNPNVISPVQLRRELRAMDARKRAEKNLR